MPNSNSNMSVTDANKNAPLISVVIPSYNYGRFVTQAVDSALAQTYHNIEVIVVDDGSTDDTRVRLQPYEGRIRYVYQENQGLSAARNTGIRHAAGQWVAFLDSDDLWHPQKLAIQMRAVAHKPDVSLIATGNCEELPKSWSDGTETAEPSCVPITLADLMIKSHFSPSSVLLRKDCLIWEAPFDTSLRSVEDRDLWIRIAANHHILKVELPLVYSRIHGANMSHAAARMEHYERLVLARAFANIASIRRRFLLRSKAFSFAFASAAWMYREAGMPAAAFWRMTCSLLLWPFPYRREEVRIPFERLLTMLSILVGSLRRPLSTRCAASLPSK